MNKTASSISEDQLDELLLRQLKDVQSTARVARYAASYLRDSLEKRYKNDRMLRRICWILKACGEQHDPHPEEVRHFAAVEDEKFFDALTGALDGLEES